MKQESAAQSGAARVVMLCTIFLFMGLIALSYCGGERGIRSTSAAVSAVSRNPRELLPASGGGVVAVRELSADDLRGLMRQSGEERLAFEECAGREYQASVDDREGTIRIGIFRANDEAGAGLPAGGNPANGPGNGPANAAANRGAIPDLGNESRMTVDEEGTRIVFRRGGVCGILTIDAASPGAQTLLGLLATDVDDALLP